MNSAAHETSGSLDRWGVILLAHGAPDRLEDIPEFLLNVRGGRPLPEAAVQEIIHRYSLIGGGSPLLRLTNLQAAALREVLNRGAGADGRPVLRHDCAGTRGTSGGPVLVDTPDGWRVAGVQVAGNQNDVGGLAVPATAIRALLQP